MMQLEGFQAGHACEIARVSRAGFYRHYDEHEPRQADVVLRDLIQQIASGESLLRLSPRDRRIGPPGSGGEPQARVAAHARRQPVGGA